MIMQSENPYRAPSTDLESLEPELPPLFVDGPYLVVANRTALPPRCIRTNQPVGEKDYVRQRLNWRGRAFRLVVSEKECRIVWFGCPAVLWKHRSQRIANLLSTAFFVIPIFLIDRLGLWIMPLFGFGFALLIMTWFISPVLKVVDCKRGRFWIKGCSPVFLRSLEEEGVPMRSDIEEFD